MPTLCPFLHSQQFGPDNRQQTDRQYSANGDYSYLGLSQARPLIIMYDYYAGTVKAKASSFLRYDD